MIFQEAFSSFTPKDPRGRPNLQRMTDVVIVVFIFVIVFVVVAVAVVGIVVIVVVVIVISTSFDLLPSQHSRRVSETQLGKVQDRSSPA